MAVGRAKEHEIRVKTANWGKQRRGAVLSSARWYGGWASIASVSLNAVAALLGCLKHWTTALWNKAPAPLLYFFFYLPLPFFSYFALRSSSWSEQTFWGDLTWPDLTSPAALLSSYACYVLISAGQLCPGLAPTSDSPCQAGFSCHHCFWYLGSDRYSDTSTLVFTVLSRCTHRLGMDPWKHVSVPVRAIYARRRYEIPSLIVHVVVRWC